MTTGKSGHSFPGTRLLQSLAKRSSRADSNGSNGSRGKRRGSAAQRRAVLQRQLQAQPLEARQLLAGPDLIGIQPNVGQLIAGASTVRATSNDSFTLLQASPNEFVIRFDEEAAIDPSTLGTAANPLGINITRAGSDGGFESATATTDFLTGGLVEVEFRSTLAGVSGNDTQVNIFASSQSLTVPKVVIASADPDLKTIDIRLNTNTRRPATMRDLVSAINESPLATQVVRAFEVRGDSPLTPIGADIPATGLQLTLDGANAAFVESDLGLGQDTLLRIIADQSGSDGRRFSVNVTSAFLGNNAPPILSVASDTINVQLNSTPGSQSTINDLLNAINNTPTSSELVTARLERGDATQAIGGTFAGLLSLNSGGADTVVPTGYVGIGNNPNEVVFRFAEPLPDDTYQIEIFGTGDRALRDVAGDAFNDSEDFAVQFGINRAPQVLAVVPEPITRSAGGTLSPKSNAIQVHFTTDVNATVLDPTLYQLIYTRDTATGADDEKFTPDEVTLVEGQSNVVELLFSDSIDNRAFSRIPDPDFPTDANRFIPGSIRLKVGDNSDLPITPRQQNLAGFAEAGDSFATALPISISGVDGDGNAVDTGDAGQTVSLRLTNGEILNTLDPALSNLLYPGGSEYPGIREIRPDDPSRLDRTVPLDVWRGEADTTDGITTAYYNFPSQWAGDEPTSQGVDLDKTYNNLITSQQQDRVREVLSLFSEYLGIQFIEIGDTAAGAVSQLPDGARLLSVAVGELYGAVDGGQSVNSAVGGVTLDTRGLDANGETFVLNDPAVVESGARELLVLDAQDFDDSVDDQTGGEFFRGALLGVGQLLGYGYADHLPQPVSQSNDSVLDPFQLTSPNVADLASGLDTNNEALFPSPSDIINGQYLFRPESNDVDLYRFELQRAGKLNLTTVAERLSSSSTLDTALRLYRLNTETSSFEEIAANDDYFSNDSMIEIDIDRGGTYVLGVSASGNDDYNPVISGTGMGGVTNGAYELVLTFETAPTQTITDGLGAALDGDADGEAGGEFNYWFRPTDPDRTLYVDSLGGGNGLGTEGTITRPFREIDRAIDAAELRLGTNNPVEIIRVVGGGDYSIGRSLIGNELVDGDSLDIPQNVTLMIDAGSTFRMSRSRIGVGSSTDSIDRSGASLQVLGTPDNPVEFVGIIQQAGSWGGIDFRGDIDFADDSRVNLEDRAVFLNHIQYADIRHAGGEVSIDGLNATLAAIEMTDVRATVINSSITDSADFAIAATPDTFAETRYDEARFQNELDDSQLAAGVTEAEFFTSDVVRIGPHIRGNRILDNTYNGIGIRLETPAGGSLESLNVNARFDDTDIVHILTENLLIEGTPGGANAGAAVPSTLLINAEARPRTFSQNVGDVAAGQYVYRITFVDGNGFESAPSQMTSLVNLTGTGSIRLTGLPVVPQTTDATGRRLYRAPVIGTDLEGNPIAGEYRRVARLNTEDTTYVDTSAEGTNRLDPNVIANPLLARAGRLDPSLVLDPGLILKLDNARIDVTFGSHLYAEGLSGQNVVLTSLNDDRYGAGGTFNTNSLPQGSQFEQAAVRPGDWSGIFSAFGADLSLDHAVVTGAGGVSRVAGGFASFNAVEAHQSDLRIANTRFEFNADGRIFLNDNPNNVNNPDDPREERVGRVNNASGTVFVRGAQPTIVDNTFIDGSGPALSFDVNSFTWQEQMDAGRSTGELDATVVNGNSGPLISGNHIGVSGENGDCTTDAFGQNTLTDSDGNIITCSLNGLEVRGGRVASEIVWDDTDIVHIVRDMIEVPNQHIYGGLRLESDARGSLVVKFQNQDLAVEDVLLRRQAGIVVGGTLLSAEDEFIGINDRIGGSLQIVGQPDFPVILTALLDDTVGAGFTPDGRANVDTDNNGVRVDQNGDPVFILTSDTDVEPTPPLLPLGPEFDRTNRLEVDLGNVIDNDIDPNNVGFFQATVNAGGEIQNVVVSGQDQVANNPLLQQNLGFLYTTYIDVTPDFPFLEANDPAPIRLIDAIPAGTVVNPVLVSPDVVRTSGVYELGGIINRDIRWTAESFFVDNRAVVYTKVDFETLDGASFNAGRIASIDVISYLDQGVNAQDDDVLYQLGTPGQSDFRLLTLNETARIGFSHGGVYENDTNNQNNAEYLGWSVDDNGDLLTRLEAEILNPTIPGNIPNNYANVPFATQFDAMTAGSSPLGPGGNVGDLETAHQWRLDGGSDSARLTSFVEFITSDPANPFSVSLPSPIDGAGSWDGITIREAASDFNVSITSENEPSNVGNSDTNAIPSQAQYLGELAEVPEAGDENRRVGLIVDGEISSPSDEDVYSFRAEAGTQIWLDIDRTNSRLDTVVELIDFNGRTLVLSDNSNLEAKQINAFLASDPAGRDTARAVLEERIGDAGTAYNAEQLLGLKSLLADTNDPETVFQDEYSTNRLDAGMRITLPGTFGQRGIYHVRVRSSSTVPDLTAGSSLGEGLTEGAYQLQIRLEEDDVFPGTQVRYSDVRFAVNGVQIIGGPTHSPLTGDDFETSADNDTLAGAQRLGLYDTQFTASNQPIVQANGTVLLPRDSINQAGGVLTNRVDIDLENPSGPLNSDNLAKNVSGFLASGGDVDWYEFDVDYRQITRDDAALYLATVFDIDYADGQARPDTALYVFDETGALILVGGDSNVADDQAAPGVQSDPAALARGSFGTADPYIGSVELPEGTYFVAVSNQSREPEVLDQFTNAGSLNPLLRLEPVDSVRRIAEETFTPGFHPGTASDPVVPVLFDDESIIDYSFDDVLLYVNTPGSLALVNPFTGFTYANIGNFGDEVRDIAFAANGELFAYTGYSDRGPGDNNWSYNRIDTANAALTQVSVGAGMSTFHDLLPEAGRQILDVSSNDGIEVEGITIRHLGREGQETGFFVGNRPVPRQGLTEEFNGYTTNILYAFDEETGLARGVTSDRSLFNSGAGTSTRELGQIDTEAPGTQFNVLGITDAMEIDAAGVLVPSIADGDTFTLSNGPDSVTFEFNQGFSIVSQDPSEILNGTELTIEVPGRAPVTFELTNAILPLDDPGNLRFAVDRSASNTRFIESLVEAIRGQGIPVSSAGIQLSLPTASLVTVDAPTNEILVGISLVGAPNIQPGNREIVLLPTDSAATIAERIQIAVQAANNGGALPTVNATPRGRSLDITGVVLGVTSSTGALSQGGFANGGSITGIEIVGSDLFAISDTGGLYIVNSFNLNADRSSVDNIGQYVRTATDLVGLNFTGLRAGPNSVDGGAYSNLLFGTTSTGRIYAFNTAGQLQPVFAGGRKFIDTGVNGALGLDFATLDYNLWHVTGSRGGDLGHGINQSFADTHPSFTGGNSLAFNYQSGFFGDRYAVGEDPVINDNTPNENVRLDGQDVQNTYNFPGGAKGTVQSNEFSLEGYASADEPTMYFSYFLETDGQDEDSVLANDDDDLFDEDRDTLRVYVIDANGVEHLVASNNAARLGGLSDDEFDDPPEIGVYDDDIDVDVQQLFDNTGTWRQARVPLGEFAGQSNLALRVEFATAGTTLTGTAELRTVAGSELRDGQTFEIGGETFTIDMSAAITFPSGQELETFLSDAANSATFNVDGQEYLLNVNPGDPSFRTPSASQISINLLALQPVGTELSDLTAVDIAAAVRQVFDSSLSLTDLLPSGNAIEQFYQANPVPPGSEPDEVEDFYDDNPGSLFTVAFNGVEYVLNDGDEVREDINFGTALGRPRVEVNVFEVYENFVVDVDDPSPKTSLVELTVDEVAAVMAIVLGEPDLTIEFSQLVPSNAQLSNLYDNVDETFIVNIAGVEYVLDDGFRIVLPGQVPVPVEDPASANIAGELQTVVQGRMGVQSPVFEQQSGFNFSDPSDPFLPFPPFNPTTPIGPANPDVSSVRNDLIYEATPLPYTIGNKTISGRGALGTITPTSVTNSGDVDMLSVVVTAGTEINVDSQSDQAGVDLNIRFFDEDGGELLGRINQATDTVSLFAPADGVYFIGISGPENSLYDPRIEGSTDAAQVGGYDLSITIAPPVAVGANDAIVEFNGVGSVTATPGSGLVVGSDQVIDGTTISVSINDSPVDVARKVQTLLANRFAGGDLTKIPRLGSVVRTPDLSQDDFGPFTTTSERYGDQFGGNYRGGAALNDSNGAFIDDIIIGFAERGEIATDALPLGTTVAQADGTVDVIDQTFVASQRPNLTSPAQPVPSTVSGSYQLEIRDASEYVDSSLVPSTTPQVLRNNDGTVRFARFDDNGDLVVANGQNEFLDAAGAPLDLTGFTGVFGLNIEDNSPVTLDSTFEPVPIRGVAGEARFRTFDTNDRLAESGLLLEALPAAAIQDATTFVLADSDTRLTFEFDILNENGSSNGSTPDANRIILQLPRTASAAEVADELIRLVNSTEVQSVLAGSAARSNGTLPAANANAANASQNADPRIVLFGGLQFLGDPSMPGFTQIQELDLRGDTNRARDQQGTYLIENNRFLFSSNVGVEITRAAEAQVLSQDGRDATPSVLTYARNLFELNTRNFIPGVVVQNNVMAFNANAGLQITGIDSDGNALQDPVGFDRILNNTLIGGNVQAGPDLGQQIFGDVLFENGGISFADAVIFETLDLGDDVDTEFTDVEAALSSPDCHGIGPEPETGQFTFSLGSGGQATFAFQDNLLTGDGTSAPDLVIFETGEPEAVRVEVSRDGVSFFAVGTVFGIDNLIDLDQFGFGPTDQFAFVRLTDLSPAGTFNFGAAGADIDAIGALSTVAREVYTPGSQGIVVSQNSAPTLLNNIVANFQTGIAIEGPQNNLPGDVDVSRDFTVIGGTTYYRNANNARNDFPQGVGLVPQFVSPFQQIFVDPLNLVFAPQDGTLTIDSGIDSLEDRTSLATVRTALGLPERPIIAPRLDLNGQLRVDNPNFENPVGIGSNVFVDRGAEENRDLDGPRFVLTSPRGDDLFDEFGRAITRGTIFDAFEIQLIDGLAPAESTPGVGIDDSSVRPELVRVTRLLASGGSEELLSEGVDYRFAYEPADNKIRLTPIAGVWPDDSVYRIELLGNDASEAATGVIGILRADEGRLYADGATTEIGDNFIEADAGILLSVLPNELTRVDPLTAFTVSNIDGQTVTIFDGEKELTFEFDTEAIPNFDPENIPVRVPASITASQLSDILAREINESELHLVAIHLQGSEGDSTATGRLQLLGATEASRNSFVSIPQNSFLRQVNQVLDVQLNIEITDGLNGQRVNNFNGQVLTVFDGTTELTFEFDTDGVVLTDLAGFNIADVIIAIRDDSSPREIVTALLEEITRQGLNVQASGASGTFRISGTDSPIAITSDSGAANVSNQSAIGVSPGFGIQVPTIEGELSTALVDGQTFTITRGGAAPITFEVDFDGTLIDPANIPVRVLGGGFGETTPDQIADALVVAVTSQFPNLLAQNVGGGLVVLQPDVLFSLNMVNTALEQSGAAGRGPSVSVLTPLDDVRVQTLEVLQASSGTKLAAIGEIVDLLTSPETGTRRIANSYFLAVQDVFEKDGFTTTIVGNQLIDVATGDVLAEQPDDRIIIRGEERVRGQSIVTSRVQDEVGNALIFGEATVFVGGQFDYGDAPRPYLTDVSEGPRHRINEGAPLYIGSGVTADPNGNSDDSDIDDGVTVLGAFKPGFSTQLQVAANQIPGTSNPVQYRAATGPVYFDAFFDWNGNGSFEDPGELVRYGTAGTGRQAFDLNTLNTLVVNVPATAQTGDLQARFRLSSTPELNSTASAENGEVEDYTFEVVDNPFQSSRERWDVNDSGAVTPLDALLIINVLNANGSDVLLANPPAGLFLPPFPDVDGNGRVSASDALQVINRLNELTSPGTNPGGEPGPSGEEIATTSAVYMPVADGVMATAATVAFEPIATTTTDESELTGSEPSIETKVVGGSSEDANSVFDSHAVIQLDSIVDSLAQDRQDAESEDSASPGDPVDDFFASIG